MGKRHALTGRTAQTLGLTLLLLAAGCGANRDLSRSSLPESGWIPAAWEDYLQKGATGNRLPDFSRAGYRMGDASIPDIRGPVFDVTRFGAVPDDGKEDTAAVQRAVDAAGVAGGGVVFLPKGRYEIHQTPKSPYLTITSDHIVLRGEGSQDGGTVLFMEAPAGDGPIRRLGTVPAEIEARKRTVVEVIGPETRKELAVFTKDVARGQRDIPVSNARAFTEGQDVIIECTDPLVDPEHPSPGKSGHGGPAHRPLQIQSGTN